MKYISSQTGQVKDMPEDIFNELHKFLDQFLPKAEICTAGELQDLLLQFKCNGKGLLINQLCPVYLHLMYYGRSGLLTLKNCNEKGN